MSGKISIFKDKERRAAFTAFFSFLISFVFAVYNGYFGIKLGSVWNGSICVYYILLTSVRGIIVFTEKKLSASDEVGKATARRKTFIITSVILFVINIALITPVAMMTRFLKTVDMGTVPAIASAAYATYKIIAASVNYKKNRKNENLSVRQLKSIGFIDALVSVLTLQNTLIMVNGSADESEKMFLMSAITSGIIIAVILALSIIGFAQGLKEGKTQTLNEEKENASE